MIIQANEEGRKALQSLCDVALKTGGLQNMAFVSQLLMSIRPMPPQSPVIEEQEAKFEKPKDPETKIIPGPGSKPPEDK